MPILGIDYFFLTENGIKLRDELVVTEEEMNNARKEDAYKHHEVYASAFGSVSIGAFR